MFKSIAAQFRTSLPSDKLQKAAQSQASMSDRTEDKPGADRKSTETMKLAPSRFETSIVTTDPSTEILGGEAGEDLIALFERNRTQTEGLTSANLDSQVICDPTIRECRVTFVDSETPKQILHNLNDKSSFPRTQKETIQISQLASRPKGWQSGGGINLRDHNVECLRSKELNQYLTNMGDTRLESRGASQERRDVREMICNTVEQLLKDRGWEGILLPLESVVRDTAPNCTGAASGFSIMHEDFSDPFNETYDSFHQRWSRTATERLQNLTKKPDIQFCADELRACSPIKMINAWVLLSDKLEADPLVVRVEGQDSGLPDHRKVETNLTLRNNENFNTVYVKKDDNVADQWITLGKAHTGDMLVFDSQHSVHGLSAFTDQPSTASRRSVEVRFVLVDTDSLPPGIKHSLATQTQETAKAQTRPTTLAYSMVTGSF